MNYRTVFSNLGKILLVTACFYVFPIIVGLCLKEYECLLSFVYPLLISAGLGGAFLLIFGKGEKIRSKEGIVIVGFSWVIISAIGALPLTFSKAYPSYIDSLFEMISGFTTTGASLLTNYDIPMSIHFWRCLSHWLGGMGILVFLLALLPSEDGDFNLMKFESPGPKVSKLVSKIRSSAFILYGIYTAFTVLEFLILKIGGVGWLDSVLIALSTAGTGGFSCYSESIAYFNSAFVDIVVTVFMLIFSINFSIYFMLFLKKFSSAFQDEELRFYLLFVISCILLITIDNTIRVAEYGKNFFTALRYSAFTVISFSSTTGFATADATAWSTFSQIILVILMIMGGMAGSTGGGLKASRALLLMKTGKMQSVKKLRPNGIYMVKLNKKAVPEETLVSIRDYFFIAFCILVVGTLLVAIDPACQGAESSGFVTAVTSTLTCFNNVGPGLGGLVGPVGNYAAFTPFTKIVLSLLMLIGRLEIFPILLLFSPKTWSKKY